MVAFNQQEHANAASIAGSTAKPASNHKRKTLVTCVFVALTALVAGLIYKDMVDAASIARTPVATPAHKRISSVEALKSCRMIIRRAAYDHDRLANLPAVEAIESSEELTFTWDQSTALTPGSSQPPGFTASCSLNKRIGGFTKLTVNGKKIIPRS